MQNFSMLNLAVRKVTGRLQKFMSQKLFNMFRLMTVHHQEECIKLVLIVTVLSQSTVQYKQRNTVLVVPTPPEVLHSAVRFTLYCVWK